MQNQCFSDAENLEEANLVLFVFGQSASNYRAIVQRGMWYTVLCPVAFISWLSRSEILLEHIRMSPDLKAGSSEG